MNCLVYSFLLSRRAKPRNENDHMEKEEQKKEFQENFNVKYDGTYNFSRWRTVDAKELAFSKYEVGDKSLERISNDILFHHMFSVHVLQEFRCHDFQNNEDVGSKILVLARLDSWIATVA